MQKPVLDALNDQIRKEFESAYVYLAMSAHLDEDGFEGFAGWMRAQAQEEVVHAMRLFDYLLTRGQRVALQTIAAPHGPFGDPLSIFQSALGHEREITASIHALYRLAGEHIDVATQRELDWFIVEQVEEEQTAQRAVDLLAKASGNDAAYLMLDREFGARSVGEEETEAG